MQARICKAKILTFTYFLHGMTSVSGLSAYSENLKNTNSQKWKAQSTYTDWELCNFRFYWIEENTIYRNVHYISTLLLKCIRYRDDTFGSM